MADLIRFDQDGIEILIDTETGESFLEVNGYSRLSGITPIFIEKFNPICFGGKNYVSEEQSLKVAAASAVEQNNPFAAAFITKLFYFAINPERKTLPEINMQQAMESANGFYSYYFPRKAKQKITNVKIGKQRVKVARNEEFRWQKKLLKEKGGETEVQTEFGRIDLLTDTTLFEIKEARLWKSGIGQLLAYSNEYPNHKLVLFLFGDYSMLDITAVKQILEPLNIQLELANEQN